MVRPTLFDFNGVLVDDERVHFAAFRDVVRDAGVSLDEQAYFERYLGFDDADAFRAMLRDAGRSPTDAVIRALVEAKKPVYMARITKELVVFDGAVDLVRRRAARAPVGIVSGAVRSEIEHVLGVLNLRDAFAVVVSAEDAPRGKPEPEGYLRGVAGLGEHGAEAVAVEDSVRGVRAAKAAKLRCAAVAHSYDVGRLKGAGADVAVATLAELTDEALDGE